MTLRNLLRLVLIDHPLLGFSILLAPAWLAATLACRAGWLRLGPRPARRFALVAGSVTALMYLGLLGWYLATPVVVDHLEPSLMAVSWLFVEGHPIYHPLESSEIYSLVYGPAVYLTYGLAFTAFEPGLFVARIPGVLAALLALTLTYRSVRRDHGPALAGAATALLVLMLLIFGFKSFRARVDPLILVSIAAALWSAGLARWWLAAVLSGLAFGFCVNVKLHGVLYCLPLVVLLWRRHGLGGVVTSGITALGALLLPFFAFGQISLGPYVEWIRGVSRHGLLPAAFLENLGWALLLCVPLAVVALHLKREAPVELNAIVRRHAPLIVVTVLGMVLSALAGSKVGSGPHHLMPFTPLLVYAVATLTARIGERTGRGLLQSPAVAATTLAYVVACLTTTAATTARDIVAVRSTPAARILEDIRRVEQEYPDATIEMGYGSRADYFLSWYRTRLVFDGHPYSVDPGSLMEYRRSGPAIGEPLLDRLRAGTTTIWLIPKGSRPFEMRSFYPAPDGGGRQDLFGDAFRRTFLDAYEPRGSSRYFDLWFHESAPEGRRTSAASP